ncbi:four-carbon acid sugar kinase family protein, partial [Bordetella pertussis]|uniref:four-carbon acid sugar kinase family protein n=1 Tax=Bordetella pertussis TaxID=520 RepID=UPI000A844DDE
MGGPYIGIVADDLTGSGDTAVQFVRAGWATQLSVGGAEQALADPAVRQAEVLAVTTHSRPLAAADAAAVVRGEVERLRAAGVQRLYKKVDSRTTPMCSGWRAPSACWASAPCPSARAGW